METGLYRAVVMSLQDVLRTSIALLRLRMAIKAEHSCPALLLTDPGCAEQQQTWKRALLPRVFWIWSLSTKESTAVSLLTIRA